MQLHSRNTIQRNHHDKSKASQHKHQAQARSCMLSDLVQDKNLPELLPFIFIFEAFTSAEADSISKENSRKNKKPSGGQFSESAKGLESN